MFLVQLTFSYRKQKHLDRETLQDAMDWYLACLAKNGQIVDQYVTGWEQRRFMAFITIVRRDALAEKHHSGYGRRDLNELGALFGVPPTIKILAVCHSRPISTWRKSRSLFLHADAMKEYGALFCGDTGACIPAYTLPMSDDDRERLYFWWKDYISHDRLWLYSGALEIPAYKQMASPDSLLSSRGREFRAKIEKSTRIPTFYCLKRYWGRNKGEEERLCPGCGQKWHIHRDLNRKYKFHEFPFRCEPCRLVSYIADAYDDERHARIGEYRK